MKTTRPVLVAVVAMLTLALTGACSQSENEPAPGTSGDSPAASSSPVPSGPDLETRAGSFQVAVDELAELGVTHFVEVYFYVSSDGIPVVSVWGRAPEGRDNKYRFEEGELVKTTDAGESFREVLPLTDIDFNRFEEIVAEAASNVPSGYVMTGKQVSIGVNTGLSGDDPMYMFLTGINPSEAYPTTFGSDEGCEVDRRLDMQRSYPSGVKYAEDSYVTPQFVSVDQPEECSTVMAEYF